MRIGDALQNHHDVEYFFGSTREFIGGSGWDRVSLPLRAFRDWRIASRLRRYQQLGKFDLWQIHNVMPGLSPSVYQTALDLGIPTIHFLHNYRFGCVNGMFLNHGQPCQRCLKGNFWPAFLTACWHDSHLISGWQSLILLNLRRRKLFHRINRWIALSEAQKDLHLKMGFPGEQVSVVPHFYEPKAPPPPAAPMGPVLFLGRLSPEKGCPDLLQAWAHASLGPRELWIGGTGPEEERLRRLASAQSSVRFLGFLNPVEQSETWSKSSFAVIPSIVPETFGMIVLEAWARQRPVIAYRIGALAETIEDGVDGLLVTPGDVEGLARAIQRLASDPSLNQRLGQAGHAKLRQRYSHNVWLGRMEKIYASLLPA